MDHTWLTPDERTIVDVQPTRKGLRAEAWVAIGTIGAAVVTGMVTLLIHVIPPAEHPSAAGPNVPRTASASPTASAPLTASASPSAIAATLDSIVGKWAGTARDRSGTSFQITLEIKAGCALGRLCGSIGVSHVPCYGEIFLESVNKDEVEFRVANFAKKSNQTVCQPGAGEYFRLQSDGTLTYHATYEPQPQGTLRKIST